MIPSDKKQIQLTLKMKFQNAEKKAGRNSYKN